MSKELRRLIVPKSWPVKRKAHYWVTKPSPGAHSISGSVPVNVVARDMLGLCDTANEVRTIISNKDMLVDGKKVTNIKQGVGLMDVVSFPKMDAHYRMLVDRRGKLRLVKVAEEMASWKLCRIENKTTIRGGKTQLNLHDGRNVLVEEDNYKTGDVLKIEMPSQKILDVYKLAQGNMALITSGSHAGKVAVVEEIIPTHPSSENLVNFTDGSSTTKSKVFIIGTTASEIDLPEEAAI